MKHFRYEAARLLSADRMPMANALRLSVLAASGSRAMQGQLPFERDTLSRTLRGFLSFYPDESLLPKAPRFTLTFIGRDDAEGMPARAVLEVEYKAIAHGRAPVEIDIVYPDRLLGFEPLVGAPRESRYTSLYFNLTPCEYDGNLFDAISPVCAAFAATEDSYRHQGAQERLDGDRAGRFSATYAPLHSARL